MVLIRFIFLVAGLAILGCSSPSQTIAKENDPMAIKAPSEKRDEIPVVGSGYRERYKLQSASQKLVTNTGLGFEELYGTRNFRAVLNGVYYRGGANNAFLKPVSRNNSNPLPDVGIESLCKEGFGHAVYLYSTNFDTAPKELECRTFAGHTNKITYLQISPLSYKETDQRILLDLIFSHIRDPRLGPIYDHCWNGWHASGFVASITLRQFCGFTVDQAIAYWNLNTDGNNGSSYNKVRDNIRKFQPYPDLELTAAEKAKLCPSPDSLDFAQ